MERMAAKWPHLWRLALRKATWRPSQQRGAPGTAGCRYAASAAGALPCTGLRNDPQSGFICATWADCGGGSGSQWVTRPTVVSSDLFFRLFRGPARRHWVIEASCWRANEASTM
jgi:hypothetical protein